MSQPGWVERYHDGERAQVWHELRQLGARLRPDEAEQAQLVCDEMALRARHNVEVLVERLAGDGFRFHSNDDEQKPVVPFVPATEAAAGQAEWLVGRFGPVPLTVLSWLRLVGDVWLVGTHPDWPESAAADPLVIELEGSRYPGSSIRDSFDEEAEMWQDDAADDPEHAGVFVLPVSPDVLHKDNVSGDAPYGIALPDGCVDGLWVGETTMPFVAYLNRVFANGGFPLRSGASEQAWPVRRRLADGLLPL